MDFACPKCKGEMFLDGNTKKCKNNHCFDKAKAGDAASTLAVDNAASHLGTIIGSFINMLNLDAVIIGGGVAMAGNFFLDKIEFHTKQIAWPLFMENLPILPAKLQNDAGIIGAASLILEEEK